MIKKIIIIAMSSIAGVFVLGLALCMLPDNLLYWYGLYVLEEPAKPVTEEASFPFTLTYEVNGERKVIQDIFTCRYSGSEWTFGADEKVRTWEMELDSGGDSIILWEGKNKKGLTERIVWGVTPEYYMGDTESEEEIEQLEKMGKYEEPTKEDYLYPHMTKMDYYNTFIELQTVESEDPNDVSSSVVAEDKKRLAKYGIKIIDWKCKQPIKNRFID